MFEKLMTVEEVADYLSISPYRLRNKDFRNKYGLNVIRIGGSIRFKREDIKNFVSRNTETNDVEED
jgi:hypothetical protein